ncbi:hypothetical protein PMAA_007600 [Talaromyces marneffei ATCC 18224]|uniref:Reverse transcriptase n=1 Tax=Talaromyces marneffei (strain ATCC 18224 / CBS 334.59 / QM 7333) TaxID=441960 RepID=B6QU33_TALMQ|nr:hypothetical protein PMAA_007600 [Talaromyces marneffei ATCC 18224]
MVGMGGYIRDTQADNNGTDISRYSITLGKRTEQNPYTAELEAIAVALERAAHSNLCVCGQASETVEHFLFRCTKWTAMREGMNQCTESKRGNLSFFLGGKTRSDSDQWQPDMKVVHAAIKFAITTGRLEPEPESESESQSTQ